MCGLPPTRRARPYRFHVIDDYVPTVLLTLRAESSISMTDFEVFKELTSSRCWCGAWKRRGYPLCGPDYFSLPSELQVGLRARLGRGYTEARAYAIHFLRACRAEQNA
jgi:hypothetical protein